MEVRDEIIAVDDWGIGDIGDEFELLLDYELEDFEKQRRRDIRRFYASVVVCLGLFCMLSLWGYRLFLERNVWTDGADTGERVVRVEHRGEKVEEDIYREVTEVILKYHDLLSKGKVDKMSKYVARGGTCYRDSLREKKGGVKGVWDRADGEYRTLIELGKGVKVLQVIDVTKEGSKYWGYIKLVRSNEELVREYFFVHTNVAMRYLKGQGTYDEAGFRKGVCLLLQNYPLFSDVVEVEVPIVREGGKWYIKNDSYIQDYVASMNESLLENFYTLVGK